MALASAPTTPERWVPPPSIRRSFTAPIKSARSPVPIPEEVAVDSTETLYSHNGKIVSFNTLNLSSRRHSSVSNVRAESQEEPAGTLPWATTTERTIAAGSLSIHRVLGTAFLSSGRILHPILPKSQCWCVDGESKFVLRIRPNNYYRIELPSKNVEDKEKTDELKTVFEKILQYEVTACPFKRGFTVDLPEAPATPVQKRPWRPKTRLEPTPERQSDGKENAGYKLNDDTNLRTRAEDNFASNDTFMEPGRQNQGQQGTSEDSDIGDQEDGNNSEATSDPDSLHQDSSKHTFEEPDDLKTSTRPMFLGNGRAITAPPKLSLKIARSFVKGSDASSQSFSQKAPSSLSSSVDSFDSFHSPISPLAPSPPFPDDEASETSADGIEVSRTRRHKRDESETTVTNRSSELWDMTNRKPSGETTYHSPADTPATPTLISDAASQDDDHSSEAITPSAAEDEVLRRRTVKSKRRSQSPLPPSANLYSAYSPRQHMSGHHLTTAILQRTCSLLLGPPIQLVALMLRIAAKIARGAFRGRSSYGFGEGGQKIPCSWDFGSDGSDENDDVWEEDDYGVSLGNPVSKTSSREGKAKELGGSWEID